MADEPADFEADNLNDDDNDFEPTFETVDPETAAANQTEKQVIFTKIGAFQDGVKNYKSIN